MTKLRIKNISGNINIKKDWGDKLNVLCNILIVCFTFIILIYTMKIYYQAIPSLEESIENLTSVNIQQSINIQPSVDTLATLYRNKSIISFDVPKEIIEGNIFDTNCYIKNKQGDSIYVIEELNFTSPRLKLGGIYEFHCEIKNGEVYRILKE